MAFGVSFLPDGLQDDGGELKERRHAGQFQRVQLLNLRLPRVISGGAQLAPTGLLQAPGSLGMNPDVALIQQAMAQMAGVAQPGARPPVAPMLASRGPAPSRPAARTAMTPRVVPGVTTHDPTVEAAKQENQASYNSPNYGGVPGWTPPAPPTPASPTRPPAWGMKRNPWDGDTVLP